MSARDRVLESIKLTTPSGVEHVAKWRGNAYSVEKKVARFEYPGVDGGSTQDLGLKSQDLPLTLYFDGDNHDVLSENFVSSMSERGAWSVIHPVMGSMTLQPLSVKPSVEPVKSSTVTVVETTWIRDIPDFRSRSIQSLSSEVAEKAKDLVPDKIEDGDKPYPVGDEPARFSFVSYVRRVMGIIKGVVAKIFSVANEIRENITLAIDTLNYLLTQPYMIATNALGLLNQIIALPALTNDLVTSKIRLYKTLGEEVRSMFRKDGEDSIATAASARSNDFVQNSIVAAMCLSTTVGSVLSRAEAFEISRDIQSETASVIELSDYMQSILQKRFSKDSYLGDMAGFDSLVQLTGITVGFVISDNYAPSIEKRFRVGSVTSTLKLAIENYPDKTVDDAFDFFIDTNGISGLDNEIIFLGAGREVVVYV